MKYLAEMRFGRKAVLALIAFSVLIGGFVWLLRAQRLGCSGFCAA